MGLDPPHKTATDRPTLVSFQVTFLLLRKGRPFEGGIPVHTSNGVLLPTAPIGLTTTVTDGQTGKVPLQFSGEDG